MIAVLAVALALAPAQLPPPPIALPCVPLVDPGCPLPNPLPPPPPPPDACLPLPLPPICLPPMPPPKGDDPPKLPDELAASKGGGYVVLTWKPATDDVGVWGYRIYRDGNLVARKAAGATRVRLRLPCGRHSFRVEVVDSTEQTASRSLTARRVCG